MTDIYLTISASNLIYFRKFFLHNRGLGRCHCTDRQSLAVYCVLCLCKVLWMDCNGTWYILHVKLYFSAMSVKAFCCLEYIIFAIGCTPIGASWPVCWSVAPSVLTGEPKWSRGVSVTPLSVYPRSKSLLDSADRTLYALFHPCSPEIRPGRGNKERNLPFRKRTTIRALPFCSVLTVLTDNDLSGSWICGLGP